MSKFDERKGILSIMRIQPRLEDFNDIIINFDYYGKIICQLQIKLEVNEKEYFLKNSNSFICEVENACSNHNEASRYKLVEVLTKGMNSATDANMSFYSNIKHIPNI